MNCEYFHSFVAENECLRAGKKLNGKILLPWMSLDQQLVNRTILVDCHLAPINRTGRFWSLCWGVWRKSRFKLRTNGLLSRLPFGAIGAQRCDECVTCRQSLQHRREKGFANSKPTIIIARQPWVSIWHVSIKYVIYAQSFSNEARTFTVPREHIRGKLFSYQNHVRPSIQTCECRMQKQH